MRVLIHPANIPHVDNYLEVVRGLATLGQQTDVRAVTLEKWYSLGALPESQRCGIQAYEMPRPTGSRVPIWRTKDSCAEAIGAYSLIEQQFEEILLSFRPHLFLICGDDGLFEAGFLRSCRRFRVPSILIAEMPFAPSDAVVESKSSGEPLLWRSLKGVRRVCSFLRRMQTGGLKSQMHRFYSARRPTEFASHQGRLPQVRPIGLNGATAIAVAGPKSAERLVAHGVPRSIVRVTGWPRFDRLYRFVQLRVNEATNRSRFVGRPIEVLYASGGLAHFGQDSAGLKLLKHVLDAARILGDRARIGIRLKPGEQARYYPGIWSNVIDSLHIFENTEDLYQQFTRVDIVIGNNSTAEAEAMMMGLPVINLMQSESDDWKEFVSSGSALPAFNGADLADSILILANDVEICDRLLESQKQYLFSWFYHFDGYAGKRVAELALELCRL